MSQRGDVGTEPTQFLVDPSSPEGGLFWPFLPVGREV